MIISKIVVVKGKVQGVFFRASTKEQAELLGINGEVWNMPDGSVSLIAEGEEQNVNALIQWCHTGPPRATVREVSVNEGMVKGYKNFMVKRL